MKTPKNFKGLLSIAIAMILSIGSAYSQLNIVWNDTEVPPRARDAFKNNTVHNIAATYPKPCGTPGTPCAMNVGVIVWLSAEGGNLTNIIWSFSGTATTIQDYRIKSERDYGEGFVTECSTIPLSTSVLQNQHLINYYYTGPGTSTVTVTANVNGDVTPSSATITFNVVRDPKAETYYVTGLPVFDPVDGFDTPSNYTAQLEGSIPGVFNIPGVDRNNILGIHFLWDVEIQGLPSTLPGESFRFHRYYIQAFSCWRSIFGYDCFEPYISAQYTDPLVDNVPTGAADHFGNPCIDPILFTPDPDCSALNGTGDGTVQGARVEDFYKRIEKLPRRFSICGGATTTYSCCCHLNLVTGPNLCTPETPCASGTCSAQASFCTEPGPVDVVDCDYDMVGNNMEFTLADFATEDDLAENIVQYHNRMHDNVCHFGDFTNEWTTPNDPFFFLYHSTLQRVYQLWQYLKLDAGTITVDATDLNGAIVHYPDPNFTGFTQFEGGNCSFSPNEIFTVTSGLASGSFFPNGTTVVTGMVQDVVLIDPNFDNINFTQGEGCTQIVTFNVVVNAKPQSDVYIKDSPYNIMGAVDDGEEPNLNTYNYWLSRDIWVIDDAAGLPSVDFNDHQNPEKGQTNYVHVKLHNDGTPQQSASEPITGKLKVYWGNNSTGLIWPTSFDLIDRIDVSLAANAVEIFVVPWNPVVTGHHCLVAIFVSDLDPLNTALTPVIHFNTIQNNNVAWRNVNIVDLVGHHQKYESAFIVRNTTGTAVTVDLEIDGAAFLNNGNICMDLGQTLFSNWEGAGQVGTNIQLPGGSEVCADLAQPMLIQGIPMAAGEEHEVIISFQADPVCLNGGRIGPFYVDVIQSENGTVVGGITYEVSIGDRPDCIGSHDHMISWWTGDYPGNNLDAVDILNRNNGTRVNEVEFGEGRVDQAFVLDGINDYIRVPNDPSLDFGDDDPSGSGNFTIDAWIFLHRTPGRQTIVDKRAGSPPIGYSLFLQDAELGFGITDADGYNEFNPGASVKLGGWSHVALAVDRDGEHILYIDGNIAGTFEPKGLTDITADADLLIGRNAFGGGFLHAGIDEVKLYNRALNATEILAIFRAGSSGMCKDIPLSITSIKGTNISANGGNDGAVNITVTGGAAPLTFAWSNGATTEDVSGLTAGTYTVDVTDAHGCTQTATITLTEPTVVCPVPIGDAVLHINEILTHSATFTGKHVVEGTLTVAQGVVLTINNADLEFAGNSSIVVEQGAMLNVNLSVLKACNVIWKGIEVRGNSNKPQIPKHQGVVNINNSTVKDALIGVFAGSWVNYLQNIDPSQSGGIVKVFNNSKMVDNVVQIYLSEYNQQSKQMKIMNSQFKQTNLSTSFSLIQKHILVEGTNGLVIQGNSFEGGELGIVAIASEELQILKNIFTNVKVAISGTKNKELVIFDNTFGSGVEIGIDLGEGETFKIHKNRFDHAREAIRTRESIPGNKRSEISENRFNQQEIAIKFRDDDHSNLDIKCNEFIGYTKYAIKSYNTTMADQGSQQKGAGNTFIPNTSLAYNCFDHIGTAFTYHYDPMHAQGFSDPNIMSPTVTKVQANVNNGCAMMPNAKISNLDETLYEGYTLSNYPNPFIDGTIIAAYLPGELFNSEIVVYDVVGSVINRFPLKSGHNFIEITSDDLDAGIYFYSLISDRARIETKKMVHIK